ncbi:MAG: TerC/Alx family metal homeostasis membrane protein [Bacteroidota bacterium]
MQTEEIVSFSIFVVFILGILALDLGVFSRDDKEVSFREAGIWSLVWIFFAVGFYFLLDWKGEMIHGIHNEDQLISVAKRYAPRLDFHNHNFAGDIQTYRDNLSLEFITGYLVEYALSVDNIFVIILIFKSFRVDKKFYKKILFWGILGAIVMRCIFIFLGSALVQEFHWILYIFGAFLIYTGGRMMFEGDKEEVFDTANHPVVRLASRWLAVFPRFVHERFFFKSEGRWYITPLFLVLLIVEFTDLIFAMDSVPAVFAVTKDPLIIFFSNIFAILGLRSMFFFLAKIMHLFHFLKYGLAALLIFIGSKMFVGEWLEEHGFTKAHSFYVILGILGISVIASLLFPEKKEKAVEEAHKA